VKSEELEKIQISNQKNLKSKSYENKDKEQGKEHGESGFTLLPFYPFTFIDRLCQRLPGAGEQLPDRSE
jgi:hypothetical protein